MNRLRVTRVAVQVEAFVDDGDALTPVPLNPIYLTAAQWSAFDLDACLAPVREQVEGAAAVAEQPPATDPA